MYRLLPLALAASLLAAGLEAQRPDRGDRDRGRRRGAPVELTHFEFQEIEFESPELADGSGQCGLYLPKGWNAEDNGKEYPLAIWLHGFGGYWRFQGSGGAATLDELRGKDEIPEMIVATFRAPGGRRSRSAYLDGESNGNVESAIVKDLVAHLTANYPVAEGRGKRAIMGVSMGGFAALKIAMKRPEAFGVVAVHSAAILPDDPENLPPQYQRRVRGMMQFMGLDEVFGDPIDKERWAAEMPMGLARKAEEGTYEKLRIYFDAGSEDRYGFAEPNQQLSELMKERGIAHTFRMVEGGGHAWGSPSMVENLKHSLRFVGRAFEGKPAADGAGGADKEGAGKDGAGKDGGK